MTNLTRLRLDYNSISDISTLSGLTNLTALGVGGTSINNSALSNLSSLKNIRSFYLMGSSVTDLSALSSWTKLRYLEVRHNKNLSDISTLSNWASSLEQLYLTHNNISDVSALSGFGQQDIGQTIFELRGNPIPLSQYPTLRALRYKPDDMVLDNEPPVFTAGDSTTRSVAENTGIGTNIGNPIAATDTEGDTITYSLGGTDVGSFIIDSTSGQLQTNAALDFETKNSYTVTVDAAGPADEDSWPVNSKGLDRITVTINVHGYCWVCPRC